MLFSQFSSLLRGGNPEVRAYPSRTDSLRYMQQIERGKKRVMVDELFDDTDEAGKDGNSRHEDQIEEGAVKLGKAFSISGLGCITRSIS